MLNRNSVRDVRVSKTPAVKAAEEGVVETPTSDNLTISANGTLGHELYTNNTSEDQFWHQGWVALEAGATYDNFRFEWVTQDSNGNNLTKHHRTPSETQAIFDPPVRIEPNQKVAINIDSTDGSSVDCFVSAFIRDKVDQ